MGWDQKEKYPVLLARLEFPQVYRFILGRNQS